MTAPAIEVEIGPARVLDAGTLGALMGQANDALSWLPRVHSGAQDIMFVGDMVDAGWVRVARAEGRIVGFVAQSDGELHALYLHPHMQGKGIARALMDDVKSACTQLSLWCFEANARALRFYRKAGFAIVDRSDGSGNDAGLPDVRMTWHKKEPA